MSRIIDVKVLDLALVPNQATHTMCWQILIWQAWLELEEENADKEEEQKAVQEDNAKEGEKRWHAYLKEERTW